MSSLKKADNLVLKVRELRKEIARKVEEQLRQECEKAQRDGKYPWEGFWLRQDEIEKILKKIKRRDKVVFLELLFLFLIFALLSRLLYLMLKGVFLPL